MLEVREGVGLLSECQKNRFYKFKEFIRFLKRKGEYETEDLMCFPQHCHRYHTHWKDCTLKKLEENFQNTKSYFAVVWKSHSFNI